MSFAQLKKSSKTQFASLKDKMVNEGKGNNFNDDRFWSPEKDKSGNGFAIIRFLPGVESSTGTESPYVKLYKHAFKIGTKWFIDECPTTLEQKCPVCEANSELWNTEIKENQEIVRKRKRVERFISNIIVLSDSKHPENEGKVFLFSYGKKIFAKLMNAIEPEFEDEQAFNPFDFWEGAPFKLKIRNVEGYINYDKSEFGECGPLFEQDEAMEKVWKSQYSLKEFVDSKNFKEYNELKTKFLNVINSSKKPENDFDKEEEINKTPHRKVETTQMSSTSNSDDEDFELFRTMIEE